ncbi:MAG: SAM-dependent methyltransferase [Myxococcota bacterium]|jgi:SAM-dependent MidA family methyltransferase|nr:SAM-dependent methyltransferase [Myxococcota bacterium]
MSEKETDVARFPAFSEYASRCLYDPDFGYYSSGRVEFGKGAHFWTYPQRLRPFFGWMVAEAALRLFRAMLESGRVPHAAPLLILELGAGNGDLAADTLDYVLEHAEEPRWAGVASRLRYCIGELSASLRERQRQRLEQHIAWGRAEVRAMNATALDFEGPFYGLVVANELIDAFPCELFRIAADARVSRLHVKGLDADGGFLAREALWAQLRQGKKPQMSFVEQPLELGWVTASGQLQGAPEDWLEYAQALSPLLEDLHRAGLLPVQLCHSLELARFATGLARLLHGPERFGAALLVDYGGTSRHVLDPRSAASHLRIYGADGALAHSSEVLHAPGEYDITWDVDFTELARCAMRQGLEVPFFGHQSALEQAPIELWSKRAQALLIAGRRAEGAQGMDALLQSHELVMRFREAAGFRAMVLASPGFPFPHEYFGPSDAFAGRGLATLSLDAQRETLRLALRQRGLPETLADVLKTCGDPVADLSDHRCYALRRGVLDLLEERGWLVDSLLGEG